MLGLINKLHNSYYAELEKLFFFNPNQCKCIDALISMVEIYGEPFICREGDFIYLSSRKNKDVKSIFLHNGPKLVGVAVYFLDINDTLNIIYLAVDHVSLKNDNSLLLRFVKKIRERFPETKFLKFGFRALN